MRGVAAELLAEAHGYGVLQMSAADLDDLVELACLAAQGLFERGHGREQILVDGGGGGDVEGGGEHVVARLAAIDMVVGMRAGEAADHLIGVHVRGGAAAGLKDIDDELAVVGSRGYGFGGVLNGGGEIAGQFTQGSVDLGGGCFDLPEGAQEGPGEVESADGEVEDGALGLGSVEGVGGDLDVAHGVVFSAEWGHRLGR